MSLYSIIYLSAAEHTVTDDDLIDILQVARENNKQLDVTGMLLYRNGYFIQVLEGEEQHVKELYAAIAQDERHHHVMTLHEGPLAAREFQNWEMGFNNLDTADPAALEGYTDFLDDPYKEGFLNNPLHAHKLLLNFRNNPRF